MDHYKQIILKMSLKVENTYPLIFQAERTDCKNIKLAFEPFLRQNSPFCQETERLFNNNRQGLNIKDESFCQKETQRNHTRSRQNLLVWLSNSHQQKSEQRSNWSINLEDSNRKEKINDIYTLLEQNQLMEAFEAFEDLRNIISDELYEPSHTKVYTKLSLLEAIEILKNKLSNKASENSFDSFEKSMPHQIRQLLQQTTLLRSQNACLRQKLQQLCEKQGIMKEGNSILNNSISFHSYGSESISNLTDYSFQLKAERQIVRPFIAEKDVYQESTLGLLTDSGDGNRLGLLSSTTVNYLTSFVITFPNHQEIQTELSYHDNTCADKAIGDGFIESKWEGTLQNCVQSLKKLMRCQISAANLALIGQKDKMDSLKVLIQQINNYRPHLIQQNDDNLLKESDQLASFITRVSSEVDFLIQQSMCKFTTSIK